MSKYKKIFLVLLLSLFLVFIGQNATNAYLERRINAHLAPYNLTARLKRLNLLTVNAGKLKLTCKIKFKGGGISVIPISPKTLIRLLPDEIKISL